MSPSAATRRALAGGVLLAALFALLWLVQPAGRGRTSVTPTPLRPPATRDPLVPTPLPSFRATATPRVAAAVTAAPRRTAGVPAAAGRSSSPTSVASDRARVGVGLPIGKIADYDWRDALPGWYVIWRVEPDPPVVPGTRFVEMVRLKGDRFDPELAVIRRTARNHPGMLWLIGNEPDVRWQDNATPEQYAASYDVLYRGIHQADPTAQVAIAGVSQPTPLRMVYLDRILEAYRTRFGAEMPIDVWNVHAFILREERDSWGVGTPPGMPDERGRLYEIGDHANLDIFRQQIVDFRLWMAARGFRDKPLIVSEYGILMPDSYGFPPDLVAGFLVDTFDFFLTARDPEIGYPADDDRLVQAFAWFSVADTTYPTANLFDPRTRGVTPVGETFVAYVSALQ